MEGADFSGYASKAGLKCSDGRTIMPDAFKHQDHSTVPLVWQHGHGDVENVLGHAILENRPDGTYAYGFFNDTAKAVHARTLVEHKDVKMMSIWANNLIERSKNVMHGVIREVSLVLSGANPGAVIENVTVRHSDGDTTLDDEAIIYTGLEFDIKHEDSGEDMSDKTVQEIYDSMSEEQKTVLHYMVGEALSGDAAQHSATLPDDPEMSVEDIYHSMTDAQKSVLHKLVGEALNTASNQSNTNENDPAIHGDIHSEGKTMTNVFEQNGAQGSGSSKHVLSHDAMKQIVADAMKGTGSSLKEVVQEYALAHGITDIDLLFPDARAISDVPEFLKRRTEWVSALLAGCYKTPFSRIKSLGFDLTHDEARAKGYVKGSMKKEEFFSVMKRVTTPTTVYKKQALDRDDMLDITDFDVVAVLKGEMRLMLDEELARAILLGDGRDIAHEDKINEQNIRPIASDHELYTTQVNVNIDDNNSSITEVIDSIILNRRFYKGTGLPTMYTTETYIAKFLLLKDSTGRRIYSNLDEVARELRVAAIVPVEVMEDEPDLIAVLVNPVDYAIGADKGGQVSMFDDFDIDYNKHKYLIETRVCGALRKFKSAMAIRKVAVSLILATPEEPAFNPATGVITIPAVTGVVYKNAAGSTLTAGAQTALSAGASLVVNATPASGYFFGSSEGDSWTFKRDDA